MEMDYYEILGVAPDADIAHIKARYRQMVRENHPDIAADKVAAHAKIQSIIAAWTTLSQPHLRHEYDQRRHRNAADISVRSAPTPSTHQRPPTPVKPLEVDPEVAARKRARAQQVMQGHNAPRTTNPRTRLLTMVFDAAQMYHVEGRIEDAVRVCNNVLRADPTNAEAAVLLGDIYAQQGRKDAALALYERAVRLQPSNRLYRQKWEALRHHAPDNSAPTTASTRPTGPNPWSKDGPTRPLSDRVARRETAGEHTSTDAHSSHPENPVDELETATEAAPTAPEPIPPVPAHPSNVDMASSEPATEKVDVEGRENSSFFARWRARRSAS